jgi:hypothetical protein
MTVASEASRRRRGGQDGRAPMPTADVAIGGRWAQLATSLWAEIWL